MHIYICENKTNTMEYNRSNKSVHLINYHIVWCPKYRRKLLVGKLKTRLEEIIKDVAYEKRCKIIALEVMPDHVHLFVSSEPNIAPFSILKALKGRSSNLLRKEFPDLRKMPSLWTRSYFVSSAGNASSETVQKYIENQWTK